LFRGPPRQDAMPRKVTSPLAPNVSAAQPAILDVIQRDAVAPGTRPG